MPAGRGSGLRPQLPQETQRSRVVRSLPRTGSTGSRSRASCSVSFVPLNEEEGTVPKVDRRGRQAPPLGVGEAASGAAGPLRASANRSRWLAGCVRVASTPPCTPPLSALEWAGGDRADPAAAGASLSCGRHFARKTRSESEQMLARHPVALTMTLRYFLPFQGSNIVTDLSEV